MKLHYEFLEEFTWSSVGSEKDGWVKVPEVKGDLRRWSRSNSVVLSKDGKFYQFNYEQPATENQEVEKFYPDPEGQIELKEVKPVEKTIIVYE